MLERLTIEGKWFTAKEFNEMTFGDLTESLKGHRLEHLRVKSIFGARGEYNGKASSMRLLRMADAGYVERRKQGKAYVYRLTWEGWKYAERPTVTIPVRRIFGRRFRKPRAIIPQRVDPVQEADSLLSDWEELLSIKKRRHEAKGFIGEGKFREAADYLMTNHLMDELNLPLRPKKNDSSESKKSS
jgi:hypothetical protein